MENRNQNFEFCLKALKAGMIEKSVSKVQPLKICRL